jgi:hypothetical protein
MNGRGRPVCLPNRWRPTTVIGAGYRGQSVKGRLGHEDQFPPSSLSSRLGLGKETFAWTR